MMRPLRSIPWIAFIIVLIDGWLKSYALAHFQPDVDIMQPGLFSLAIHKNFGIAFNIPLKLPVILIISVALGAILIDVAWRNRQAHQSIAAAVLLILIGGFGNVYDRIAYGFTVDYLLLFGRSAINLSDLVILIGIFWLLLASRREKSEHQPIDETQKVG